MLQSSARRLLTMTVVGLLATACAGQAKAAPKAAPTPIASLNSAAIQVPRIDFCALVPGSAITAALGGRVTSRASYGNGDEEKLPGVGQDVVHEIGCSWTGKDGDAARAWVFARPVDPGFAGVVVRAGSTTRGCRSVPGPSYGNPTLTQACQFPTGIQRVRHAGLFGQTWLTCELETPGARGSDLRVRTDQWCVEVANALNTAH